jgi:AraC-like DNA-binding protein
LELEERIANLIGGLIAQYEPQRATARRRQTDTARRRLVARLREAIDADPTRIELGHLAGTVAYSRFHISRVFRQMTGMTISQHRNRVRAAIALERLAEGEKSLARLAAELGFADESHLCRVVRGVYGVTPGTLRGMLLAARAHRLESVAS